MKRARTTHGRQILLAVLSVFLIVFAGCQTTAFRVTMYDSGQTKEEYFAIVNFEGADIKDGPYKMNFENGQLAIEGTYRRGKLDGLVTQWYPGGQKAMETNYSRGDEHGKETIWYENGQKKQETQYVNGRKSGIETCWQEDGRKISETVYESGIKIKRKEY